MEQFKIGDLIQTNDEPLPYKGIIYKIAFSKNYDDKVPHVILFDREWCSYSDDDCNDISPNKLEKLKPTKLLKYRAKRWIKRVYNKKWFDNLTYIELLDYLK